jgi:hypothetical protein
VDKLAFMGSGRVYELINDLGTYVGQNAAPIVNYCQRYWYGPPISSSPAESAASSLAMAAARPPRVSHCLEHHGMKQYDKGDLVIVD